MELKGREEEGKMKKREDGKKCGRSRKRSKRW